MNYEKWAFHDITPISRQLIQKLIYAILSNELSSGDSIPSVREMAEILHINPNVVLKSYKAVKQEHFIICSKGGKYSVTQDYDCIQQVKRIMILPSSHSPSVIKPSQAMRAALSDRQLGWNSRGVSSLLTVWRLPIAFRGVEDKLKCFIITAR